MRLLSNNPHISSWVTTTIVHCSLMGVLFAFTTNLQSVQKFEIGGEKSAISLVAKISELADEPIEQPDEVKLPPVETKVLRQKPTQNLLSETMKVSPERAKIGKHDFILTDSDLNPIQEKTSEESLRSESEAIEKQEAETEESVAQTSSTSIKKPTLSRKPRKLVQMASVSSVASTPASPIHSLNRPPIYPIEARRNRYEGRVLLKVHVTGLGSVAKVEVLKSSGFAVLDAEAYKAVKLWKFTPKSIDGISVGSTIEFGVDFQYDKR